MLNYTYYPNYDENPAPGTYDWFIAQQEQLASSQTDSQTDSEGNTDDEKKKRDELIKQTKEAQKTQLASSVTNLVGNAADLGTDYISNNLVFSNNTQKWSKGLRFLDNTPFGAAAKLGRFGINAWASGLSTDINNFNFDPDVEARMGAAYNFKNFNKLKETNGKQAVFWKADDYNNERQIAKQQFNTIADIDSNSLARKAMYNTSQNQMNYHAKINGGTYISQIGKKGLKFELVKRAKKIKSKINVDTKQIEEFKNGGFIPEITEFHPIIVDDDYVMKKFQKGGKTTRSLKELITYAKEQNPRFVQRLSEPPRGIKFTDDEGNEGEGSHYLEWATDDRGAVIYPRIQEMEDGSLKFLSGREAWERANRNNNILIMSPEEAETFFAEDPEYHTAYKRGWPEFFDEFNYPQEYLNFKKSLPDNQRNTPESEYRTYLYWQLWGKPKNFKYTLDHPNEDGDYMYNWDESDRSYHGSSIAWDKNTGIGYFIKPKHHPTLKYELDYYNQGTITQEGGGQRKPFLDEHNDWKNFRENYTLEDDGNFYKYVPINLKQGGTVKESELVKLEETNQKNVIPEGALHKNKHHIEHTDGLTQKGIPVVDNDGDQQAEIELDEIIFTLEVTKKLEELHKIFKEGSNKEKDEAAIEAGKLLVQEILYNTDDRTGLISKCQKGGKLNEFK